jgi:hypothetical protein
LRVVRVKRRIGNEETVVKSTRKILAIFGAVLFGLMALGCSQTPALASAQSASKGLMLVLKSQNISASCVKLMSLKAALERDAPTIYEQVAPGYRLIGMELMWPTTLVGWNLGGEDRRATVVADGMKFTFTTLKKSATNERGLVVYSFPVAPDPTDVNDYQTVDVYNCGPA